MTISKTNLERLNKPYRFNMVNYKDEEFIEMGLKPLYLTTYPKYINLNGNIFYGGISHYECNLVNDIEQILKVINSNVYDRSEHVYGFLNDDYPIRFSIYNNQIFFSDSWSLSVYKNNLNIRNEINKKYNLKDEFYEPTRKEIFQDYGYEYFLKERSKYGNYIEYHEFYLTPQEYFEMMISSKKCELSPFTKANELNAHDIRNWLNYNADIFMDFKCSWETTGVYNEETMAFINSLKETKLDIYNFFYYFSKQAKDWQKTIKELLIAFKVYTEFMPKVKKDENVFGDDGRFEERSYWDRMFINASRDMLIQFIGFDKIETQLPKTITTSKPNIYEEFFNPLVMGYDIVQLPKLIFDEEKQKLRWIYPDQFINTGIDRECEEEIKLIKKYVPYEERYKFLRD